MGKAGSPQSLASPPTDRLPRWVYRAILALHALEDRRRREGDAREQWVGFLIESALPRLGIPRRDAPRRLDELKTAGYVRVGQVANPKSPSRPATVVRLNADHPDVQATLEHARTVSEGYVPVEVPYGEPPDTAVIRERSRGEAFSESIDFPRPSPAADAARRALIWNVRYHGYNGVIPMELSHRDPGRWNRIRDGMATVFGWRPAVPDDHIHPDWRSACLFVRLDGPPAFDITMFSGGLVQITGELAAVHEALSNGPLVSRNRWEDIVSLAEIRIVTERLWKLVRDIPGTESGFATMWLTIKGMKDSELVGKMISAGMVSQAPCALTERPVQFFHGLDLKYESIPGELLDDGLDCLAEFYGWPSRHGRHLTV